MSFADRLVNAWYAPGPTALSTALTPLAAAFGVVTATRRMLYRTGVLSRHAVDVPVVVVGNLSAGGTGKTPLVVALVEALRARGWHPGVISRGAGARVRGARLVEPAAEPERVGDEPLLIARRGIAVAVGARRIDAARLLRAAHPECDLLVADDGLQHYALARDVEIAVVDGARGFGNGQLIPAGPLREPRTRLRSVDAVVVNQDVATPPAALDEAFAMRLVPEAFVNVVDGARTVPVQEAAQAFSGASVHAVAAIGNPARFFAMLDRLGVHVTPHAFADHHAYRASDLDFPGAGAILMTEKDAVKCTRFADARCWFLRVHAEVEDALVERIVARLPGQGT